MHPCCPYLRLMFAHCGERREPRGYVRDGGQGGGLKGGLWGYRVVVLGGRVTAMWTRGPQRPSKPGAWLGWANRRWEGPLKDPFNSPRSRWYTQILSVHHIPNQAALSEQMMGFTKLIWKIRKETEWWIVKLLSHNLEMMSLLSQTVEIWAKVTF